MRQQLAIAHQVDLDRRAEVEVVEVAEVPHEDPVAVGAVRFDHRAQRVHDAVQPVGAALRIGFRATAARSGSRG
ncbi:MAG: hypothetical protein IPK07_20385 [Deltaproteobacteria bacterium]|nr:hypothetical protein [Deltaproteobacteria bacterium]